MEAEKVLIVLPLPNAVLSPNGSHGSRGMMFAKAAATRRYRRLACEAVEQACVDTAPWEEIEISVTFYHEAVRRRDQDNAMGSLKAAYDGVVDGGLVPDDDYIHMKRKIPNFQIDKKYPRVEFTMKRIK